MPPSDTALTPAGPAVMPAATVGEVRAWWHAVRPPPGLLKRLEPVYYIVITLAIGGPFVYGTAKAALAEVATHRAVAVWGPSLALVALLALVRWGAVQGPVVFSVADVGQLLGAPLRRADLVLARLLRGLAAGTLGGAVVAALALVGIAGDGRGIATARGIGFVVAGGLLGLLGVAGAALVQGARSVDRATRRAVWPLFLLAGGLVVLASEGGRTARDVVLWTGPWGWALQPATGLRGWPAGVVLLAAAAALVTALAIARRGATATERHMARAEARGGAVAAVYSLDARFVGRNLARVSAGPRQGRRRRLPLPRRRRLAVPWRDAVAALSQPQRLVQAAALAAGGTLVCLLNADHTAAVLLGALLLYAAAARQLEPLRAETDQPGRVRALLAARPGLVLVLHTVVPGLVVLVAAALAAVGCALAGALPTHGGTAALLAVAATPAVTLCAGLSARRAGRLPPSLLSFASQDQSGMSTLIVLLWIAAWPLVAVALATLPVRVVVAHGTDDVVSLVVLLAAAPGALALGLAAERLAP
jgi:hypothetical protein